ncbi:MAG: hypothetical protein R2702_06615 [Acidimicrobiales bacterium]
MRVPIARTQEGLPLPSPSFDGDAGLDLRASQGLTLGGGATAKIGTGISIALPQGFLAFIVPRSGIALHQAVTVLNALV